MNVEFKELLKELAGVNWIKISVINYIEKTMDYDVPSVDIVMKEGLNDTGGANYVARMFGFKLEHLEVFYADA
jgi:hypothetical protein